MRKIIYITASILLLIACGSTKDRYVNGVKIPKRIPFKEFNSDTTAYIKQNFENRKPYYIGKTVGLMLDDFELPVQYASLEPKIKKYQGKGVYITGAFYFHSKEKRSRIFVKNPDENTDDDVTLLEVYFEPPYLDIDAVQPLWWKYHSAWNKESIPIIRKAIIGDVRFINYKGASKREIELRKLRKAMEEKKKQSKAK
jgi:hypothetical protein